MQSKGFFLIIFLAIFAACTTTSPTETEPAVPPANAANLEAGKKIFFTKCNSCHMVNRELTGPALKGVESRWPDKQKLYDFVRNSEAMIKKDKYSRELWLKFNQTMMNAHPELTNAEIQNILDYINSVSE